MTRIICCLFAGFALVLAGCGGSSTSASGSADKPNADKKGGDDKGGGSKVAGVWQIVKDEGKDVPAKEQVEMEFTKDGKVMVGGIAMGTYKIEGDKMLMTKKLGDMEETETLTIKSITADTMILTDPQKKDAEFKKK